MHVVGAGRVEGREVQPPALVAGIIVGRAAVPGRGRARPDDGLARAVPQLQGAGRGIAQRGVVAVDGIAQDGDLFSVGLIPELIDVDEGALLGAGEAGGEQEEATEGRFHRIG